VAPGMDTTRHPRFRSTATRLRFTRGPDIHGSADIGIPLDHDITGAPAIGHVRLMWARVGMPRATTDIATIPATGAAKLM
jgi:hypothetical protein